MKWLASLVSIVCKVDRAHQTRGDAPLSLECGNTRSTKTACLWEHDASNARHCELFEGGRKSACQILIFRLSSFLPDHAILASVAERLSTAARMSRVFDGPTQLFKVCLVMWTGNRIPSGKTNVAIASSTASLI